MTYQLKSLLMIWILSCASFWVGRKTLGAVVLGDEAYVKARNLWLAITSAAFLTGNFWLFCAISLGLIVYNKRHISAAPMFLLLLVAIPGFQKVIEGFGPINNLFHVSFPKLLSLAVLLPAFIALKEIKNKPAFGQFKSDWFIVGAGVLQFSLQFPLDTLTNTLRVAFYFFIEIFLPYWVMSRSVDDVEKLRKVFAAYVLGIAAISLIAVFEFGKGWLLYDSLDNSLGVYMAGSYLTRGDSGWLRASASSGHSLALGYVLIIALFLYLPLVDRSNKNNFKWWLALGAIILAGLWASLARGAWIGAVIGGAIWIGTGPSGFKSAMKLVAVALAVFGVLLLTPYADKVIDVIPFVGSSDQSTFDYRKQLLEVSTYVILQNPWFGSYDYMSHPAMQQLIQGQGIIDLVNTYVAIALSGGFVGLGLFAGAFLAALGALAMAYFKNGRREAPAGHQARGLMAALLATMVVISSMSSIHAIPWIYWSLIGLCVACSRIMSAKTQVISNPEPTHVTK